MLAPGPTATFAEFYWLKSNALRHAQAESLGIAGLHRVFDTRKGVEVARFQGGRER
jgi:hypothetical protein